MDSRTILQSPSRMLSGPQTIIYSPGSQLIRSPMRTIPGPSYNMRVVSPTTNIPLIAGKFTSPVQTILGNSQMIFASPVLRTQPMASQQDGELEQRFLNCVNRSRDLLSAFGYSIPEKPDLEGVDVNELYEKALKRSQQTLLRYSEALDKKQAIKNKSPETSNGHMNGERAKVLVEFEEDLEGLTYEGEKKGEQKHGYGVLKLNGEEVYAGEWENGRMCGKGRLRNVRAEDVEGMYDYRNFQELGNFWIVYEGDFKDNRCDGMGDLVLSNEEKFVGKFESGVVQGEGCFYRKNGEMELGLWENNLLVRDL